MCVCACVFWERGRWGAVKEMNEIRSHTALPTKFHMWLCFCICGWAVIYESVVRLSVVCG